jgi:MraZ protein
MGDQTPDINPTEISLGFLGNYQLKLDSAQRVAIPAKFREVLERKYGETGSQVVLVPDQGKVKVLPLPVWQRMQEDLNGLSPFEPNAEDYRTFVFGNMALCQLDGQSRVRLTPSLCELAELDKEVVFVGRQDGMEIWSAANWKTFNQKQSKDFRSTVAEMFRNSRSGK